MARLAAHEIDHLGGQLYVSRMRDGVNPIPVSEYHGTGYTWTYPAPGQAPRPGASYCLGPRHSDCRRVGTFFFVGLGMERGATVMQ